MNRVKQTASLAAAAVCWMILVLAGTARAQDVTVELTPRSFSIDQTARLTVEVRGVRDVEVDIGEVDDLIIEPMGKMHNFQNINGVATASITFSYALQALGPGSYTTPEISVTTGGKTVIAEPLGFSVTAADSPPSPSPSTGAAAEAGAAASISFIPARQAGYLGEVVPVQIKAYFRQGVRVDQISLPRFQAEGLLIDELDRNPRQTEEIIDNTAYRVLVWDSFMTGVKEGTQEIQLGLDATLLIPSPRRSPFPGFGSNFDNDIFGDFFSSYQSRPITVTSPKAAFEVIGLPEGGRPEGFTGAVGDFSLELAAAPGQVSAGEPITLTMTVTGTGNFNRVEAPAVSDSTSLKLYTPHGTFTPGGSPYQGEKHFVQAAVVTDPSVDQIPPVVFSFFNPDSGQYQTLFSDPFSISVAPPGEVASLQENPPASTAAAAADPQTEQAALPPQITLAPVKLETGRLVERIRPPFLEPRFIAASIICLLIITGLLGFSVYQRIYSGNPEAVHRKKVAALRKETLGLLSAADPGDPRYPVQARDSLEKLLIAMHPADRASLTLADIAQQYGEDSVAADLFRLSDRTRYGRGSGRSGSRVDGAGTSAGVSRKELHQDLLNFVRSLS